MYPSSDFFFSDVSLETHILLRKSRNSLEDLCILFNSNEFCFRSHNTVLILFLFFYSTYFNKKNVNSHSSMMCHVYPVYVCSIYICLPVPWSCHFILCVVCEYFNLKNSWLLFHNTYPMHRSFSVRLPVFNSLASWRL